MDSCQSAINYRSCLLLGCGRCGQVSACCATNASADGDEAATVTNGGGRVDSVSTATVRTRFNVFQLGTTNDRHSHTHCSPLILQCRQSRIPFTDHVWAQLQDYSAIDETSIEQTKAVAFRNPTINTSVYI